MDRNYTFKIGQKVYAIDIDDNLVRHYGEVDDTTTDKVFIKWQGMTEPVEHERSDFYRIHLQRLPDLSGGSTTPK